MPQTVLTNASASQAFLPKDNGDYHIVIGAGASDDFDGGAVSISQHNVIFEDLDAVGTGTRKIVNLLAGAPVTIASTGHSTDLAVTVIFHETSI